MATCSLSIPPDTEQVRLARLVAGAAARRVGIPEDEVDDVRLAVGEAVGRAVVRHAQAQRGDPVGIRITDATQEFVVEVIDQAGSATDDDFGLAMAVITGLVPDSEVRTDPEGGQILRMSWAR